MRCLTDMLDTITRKTASRVVFMSVCMMSCLGCNPNLDVDGALIPAWLIVSLTILFGSLSWLIFFRY